MAKALERSRFVLSRIASSGSRGSGDNCTDYIPQNTYFPQHKSMVCLMLYNGPVDDSLQIKSMEKSFKWETFFDKVDYKPIIKREFKPIVGLPHGIVFNARLNTISNFDDHYNLHMYCLAENLITL